jgi:manganese transport protein
MDAPPAYPFLAIVPAVFTILHYGEERFGQPHYFKPGVLSLQLGFAVIPLIHFTSDKKRMGKFAIGLKQNIGLGQRYINSISKCQTGLRPDYRLAKETPRKPAIGSYALVVPLVICVGLLLIYVFIRPLIFKYFDTPAYLRAARFGQCFGPSWMPLPTSILA